MGDVDADEHCLALGDDAEIVGSQRLVHSAEFEVEFEAHVREVLVVAVGEPFCEDADVAHAASDVAGQLDEIVHGRVGGMEDDKDEGRVAATHELADGPVDVVLVIPPRQEDSHSARALAGGDADFVQFIFERSEGAVQLVRFPPVLSCALGVDVQPRPGIHLGRRRELHCLHVPAAARRLDLFLGCVVHPGCVQDSTGDCDQRWVWFHAEARLTGQL